MKVLHCIFAFGIGGLAFSVAAEGFMVRTDIDAGDAQLVPCVQNQVQSSLEKNFADSFGQINAYLVGDTQKWEHEYAQKMRQMGIIIPRAGVQATRDVKRAQSSAYNQTYAVDFCLKGIHESLPTDRVSEISISANLFFSQENKRGSRYSVQAQPKFRTLLQCDLQNVGAHPASNATDGKLASYANDLDGKALSTMSDKNSQADYSMLYPADGTFTDFPAAAATLWSQATSAQLVLPQFPRFCILRVEIQESSGLARLDDSGDSEPILNMNAKLRVK